jgi:hypothetical protein
MTSYDMSSFGTVTEQGDCGLYFSIIYSNGILILYKPRELHMRNRSLIFLLCVDACFLRIVSSHTVRFVVEGLRDDGLMGRPDKGGGGVDTSSERELL